MRQDLLEKYRDINVDYRWWVDTYDTFRKAMRTLYGVEVDQINFSGFCSQGDGACFTTEWGSIPTLLTALDRQDKYPEWMFFEEPPEYKVYVSDSRYSHSDDMVIELCENQPIHDGYDGDVVGPAVWEAYVRMRDESTERLGKELLDFFRAQADTLYSMLEDMYNYLTSDEVVWDTIVANEWHLEDEDEVE